MIHPNYVSKYGLVVVLMVMATVAYALVTQETNHVGAGLGVGLLHGMWIQIVLDQPVRTPRDGKGEAPTT